MHHFSVPPLIAFSAILQLSASPSVAQAREWSIPVAGNAYRIAPEPGQNGFTRAKTIRWGDNESVFSVYFRVSSAANLQVKVVASAVDGPCVLLSELDGQKYRTKIEVQEFSECEIGRVNIDDGGYVRLNLRGHLPTENSSFEIRDVIILSDTPGLELDFVRSNEGNMFYWGRRGPSVHLTYEVPRDRKLQYAYSEITVPEGQDPIGSYYMANGFREGYFGMQVNGPQERRILFSVWSPFKTDNPRDIPADQRIATLGKGPDVHIGEFGNEGSGGQSYLVFPWTAGKTYCFLTEVQPSGQNRTQYTAWFGEKVPSGPQQWRLIASFRRPKTDTHLAGFHSFLESFAPDRGFLGRRASYDNVWVRDIEEQWSECTQARLSVDATGAGRHRLDYSGGGNEKGFFLRNCGFFNETGRPGEVFSRPSNSSRQPEIDFEQLPRG